MLPDEMQAVMAKVIFFVFATLVLCFGRAHAESKTTNSFQLSAVQNHISK
jgi:hypothetical protein